MSVAHQLNSAMLGEQVPHLITTLPRIDDRFSASFNPDTRNQIYGSLRGTDNPLRTTDGMINGGVRGVMPCCGVEATGVWGTRVLRKEPTASANGMVVPQGFAKSQRKGLAYDVAKPLNVAPQNPINFCHPDLPAKFSPAPYKVFK
jgi:hypothetical protein